MQMQDDPMSMEYAMCSPPPQDVQGALEVRKMATNVALFNLPLKASTRADTRE